MTTTDPRTEEIRARLAAARPVQLFTGTSTPGLWLDADSVAYLLGRIEALEGENARLSRRVGMTRDNAADDLAELRAERDRLRDVEEAARALVDARRYTIEESAARRNLSAALAALDGGEGE